MSDRGEHREQGRGTSRDRLAFDRSDRWGLVLLLGAVAVGAVIAWVVGPLTEWANGEPLTSEVRSPVIVPQLDATGVGYGPAIYDVLLADPSVGQRLLALAPGVLATLLVLLACWCLVLVLRTVAAGDPFEPLNVTRLRVVAAVLVIGWPVIFFLQIAVQGALLGSLDLGGLDLTWGLHAPWVPVLGGMVIAMLAEAFKAGSRLRDDVEGLV